MITTLHRSTTRSRRTIQFDGILPASAVIVVGLCQAEWPVWCRMWGLAFTVFFTCKLLTWRRALAAGAPRRLARSINYLVAWPGMDAETFLSNRRPANLPTVGEWIQAAGKTALGCALFVFAATQLAHDAPTAAAWLAMVGLVLFLHCGTFHLAALVWQSDGIVAEPIMNRPFYAGSLADFWGRRWNRAFRELADAYVYRPLTKSVGPQVAFATVFLASGLVHELVITLPAGAGYGRPTLYFLLQAAGVFVSRSAIGRRLQLSRGVGARCLAALVIVAPLGLLCPQPFLMNVIIPFLHAIDNCL